MAVSNTPFLLLYLFLCQSQSHNQEMEKGKRRRESGSRREVASWKWLHSSFCEFHTILAFHPFSNRCILSKMVGKRDWMAIFEGIVLTGSFVCIFGCVCVCVRDSENLHINQSWGWPTSLIFKALWEDLNNMHRNGTVVFKVRSYHGWIDRIYSDTHFNTHFLCSFLATHIHLFLT